MFNMVQKMDKYLNFDTASAHCDIPCKIYDPIKAQIACLTVIRFMDLIAELDAKEKLSLSESAKVSRLVMEKELHVEEVKKEVRVIWGDYFKQPQIEKYPNIHELVHQIMLAGSACKQNISRDNGEKLLSLVNDFAKIFWETKGVNTYVAKCPYPPSEDVVYPAHA